MLSFGFPVASSP